jgi:hypothetical protein
VQQCFCSLALSYIPDHQRLPTIVTVSLFANNTGLLLPQAVLFKLKPNVSSSDIDELKEALGAMVGKVPGLIRADIAPPHLSTAHRSQGYNMGLVAVLDSPETIKTYSEHPEHQK